MLCWVLSGSSIALRAPELKVTVSKQVIWVLLTGYLMCIWGKSTTFPSSSQPFPTCNFISLVLALGLLALVVQVIGLLFLAFCS